MDRMRPRRFNIPVEGRQPRGKGGSWFTREVSSREERECVVVCSGSLWLPEYSSAARCFALLCCVLFSSVQAVLQHTARWNVAQA